MKKWLALVLACLSLGLVAGCGGDDEDSGNGGGAQAPAGEGEGGVQNEGEADTGGPAQVGMENIQFEPSESTVKPGQTITFTNNEAVPHDVDKTSGPGKDFSSGPEGGMSEGDRFALTLDQPGTYEYVCRVHAPGMAGTITVK